MHHSLCTCSSTLKVPLYAQLSMKQLLLSLDCPHDAKHILPTLHLGCCAPQVQVPHNLLEQLLIFHTTGGRWPVTGGGTLGTAATCGGRVLPLGLFATAQRELHDNDRHIHTAVTFVE